jgi:type II secretory pathway component PulJ
MLVALCVTALIGGLLTAALVQLRPMNRIMQTSSDRREVIAAADYVGRLLQGSRRLALLQPGDGSKSLFEGTASQIRMVAVTSTGTRQVALRDVELAFEKTDAGGRLVQTDRPRRLPLQPSRSIVILSDVETVQFSYFHPPASGSPGYWSPTWSDGSRLPAAVKLVLRAGKSLRQVSQERLVLLPSYQDLVAH